MRNDFNDEKARIGERRGAFAVRRRFEKNALIEKMVDMIRELSANTPSGRGRST